MNDAHLDFEGGGSARLVAISADAVTLRATRSSPPGSRIWATLRDGGEKVRFKIHASKLQEDGTFVLEGRAIDMSRALRERLEQLCKAG